MGITLELGTLNANQYMWEIVCVGIIFATAFAVYIRFKVLKFRGN